MLWGLRWGQAPWPKIPGLRAQKRVLQLESPNKSCWLRENETFLLKGCEVSRMRMTSRMKAVTLPKLQAEGFDHLLSPVSESYQYLEPRVCGRTVYEFCTSVLLWIWTIIVSTFVVRSSTLQRYCICYRASYRGYRLYCHWSSNLAYLIDWLISFPHFHTLWNSTCRSPGDSITWPDEFHSNCSHTWHLHNPRKPHSHTEHTANIHPGVAESQGVVRFVFSPASWTLGILRHVKAPLTWPNSAPSKCHLQNMLQLCSVFLFTSFYLNPGVQLQPALILLASVFLQTHSRCESIGLRSTFVGSPLSGFSMFVMVLCPACGATPCHFNPFQNIWSLNSSESILRWHKHGVLSQP